VRGKSKLISCARHPRGLCNSHRGLRARLSAPHERVGVPLQGLQLCSDREMYYSALCDPTCNPSQPPADTRVGPLLNSKSAASCTLSIPLPFYAPLAPRLLCGAQQVHGIIRRSSSFNTGELSRTLSGPLCCTQTWLLHHTQLLSNHTTQTSRCRPDSSRRTECRLRRRRWAMSGNSRLPEMWPGWGMCCERLWTAITTFETDVFISLSLEHLVFITFCFLDTFRPGRIAHLFDNPKIHR
jgi:hypothetical protein